MKLLIKILFLAAIYTNTFAQFDSWRTPENIAILNTDKDEFAPFYDKLNSKLFFNSTITGKSQLYWTEFNGSDFSKPLLHKSKLNNAYEHRSYFHFASNGKVYFSKFRRTNKFPVLNLAYSEINKNNFIEPIFIEQLKCDCFCSHPTVSSNNSFIIFSSNRNNPNNLDLYLSYKNDDGLWLEPIELSEINSLGNEITPFLYNDSLLFFASDGLDGIGGYDIYYSEFYDGKWQRPLPLNDLNTEYDESDFVLIDENTAIFSSNRPAGAGGLDLYLTKRKTIEQTTSIIPQISVKFSPAELKIKKIMKYINIHIAEIIDFSEDCFNFNPQAVLLKDEIIFDYINNSIKNNIFQIAILYSKQKNQDLKIKISNDLNYNSILKKIKMIADMLDFSLNKIIFETDENLPSKTFYIDIRNKIKLNLLEYESDVANLMIEILKENYPAPLNMIIKENSTNKIIKTFGISQEKFNIPLNINELKEFIRESSKIDLSLYYAIGIDTIKTNDLNINLNHTLTKYPFMVRNNQKISFYYVFNFSNNKDDFFQLNENEIEMIKQNLIFANSIKIYTKENNFDRIGELLNSINISQKINILKTTSIDDSFNIDIPNNFILKIEISNH